MTGQRADEVIFEQRRYDLVAADGAGLFDPQEQGITRPRRLPATAIAATTVSTRWPLARCGWTGPTARYDQPS
ncbi:MAG: hypothetical protein OHK0022_52640 [Roseiflexaceae bacterium]